MSLFPKKMPVWLVALIGTIVVLVLLLISPLSNPIKRPLAKKFSELWSTRYQLDSPKAEHRIKAIRLIPYNKKHDDASWLQLMRLAVMDSNATVRNMAMAKVRNAARTQTIPDAAMQILAGKLQERHDSNLSQILSAIGNIANKHNRYNDALIMDISRMAEEKIKHHHSNAAVRALGNIGAQQPLPDASLEILTRIFQNQASGYNHPQAFEKIARQRPLPNATLSVLVAASRNHKQGNIRSAAVKALAAHCRKHSCQASWFQHALEDKNPYVRQTAADAILQMAIKDTGEKQFLIDILRDKTRPAEVRRHTVRRLLYKYRRDDDVKALLMSLADDPDATMRLIPLNYYTGLDRKQHQTNPVWLQRIKRALADPDVGVRKKAINTLIDMDFQDSTKTALLINAMQDKDAKVRAWAVGAIQPAYYKDPVQRVALDKALDKATTDPVARVRQRAKSKKQALLDRASGAYEQKRKSRKSKKKIIEWVFWVIVFIDAAIAIGYLVYYVIRFIIYLAQRRWKAMAVFLVILGWFAVSAGMAFVLLISVFGGLGGRGGGHFYVLLGLFVVTLIYAAIGWGLRYPIRR